jgi:hypothetical protein
MNLDFSFAKADAALAPPSGGPNPYWVEWRVWMANHYEVPVALVVCYLLMVWLGQLKMDKRPKAFDLARVTVAWNLALSLFSAIGFYHVARAFLASSLQYGVLNPGGVLCRYRGRDSNSIPQTCCKML